MAKQYSQWNYVKKKHDDIEFVTNKGTQVVLKFKNGEYRAYNKITNKDMMLGATWTTNLIKYIKENY